MKKLWLLSLYSITSLHAVSFEEIKSRKIYQFELVDIMMELGSNFTRVERWRILSPKSFRALNFPQAYLLAGDRFLKLGQTNNALMAYISAYQSIGSHPEKERAAYMTAFLLYAEDKRPEALFYINRALEQMRKNSSLEKKIKDLKRRISWRYFSRMDNLTDDAISAIAFDGDDVWIGTWSGGLMRYTRSSASMDTYTPTNTEMSSFYVRDVLVQSDLVWVGMHTGLAFYNKRSSSWKSISQFGKISVKRIIESEGTIYLATLYNGVFASADKGETWKNIVPRKSVLDLLKIDDTLFIATAEQGLYRYQNGSLKSFVPRITVKSLVYDDKKNILWLGTYGDGLLQIDRQSGEVQKRYREEDLGSAYIETLALVDNQLWVGTLGQGVLRFNGKKWSRLGLRDGMPGLDLTTITREKEYLWFGTLIGGLGIYLFKEARPLEESL